MEPVVAIARRARPVLPRTKQTQQPPIASSPVAATAAVSHAPARSAPACAGPGRRQACTTWRIMDASTARRWVTSAHAARNSFAFPHVIYRPCERPSAGSARRRVGRREVEGANRRARPRTTGVADGGRRSVVPRAEPPPARGSAVRARPCSNSAARCGAPYLSHLSRPRAADSGPPAGVPAISLGERPN